MTVSATDFPKYYNEAEWNSRISRDFGETYAASRPYPLLAFRYYLSGIEKRSDRRRGERFINEALRTVHSEFDDNLSSLCELALDGDADNARYQVDRERQRFNDNREKEKDTTEYSIDTKENHSVLHFSVLSGNLEMVRFILEEKPEFVNRKDLVTNFSPFHYALFSENIDIMDLLIRHGGLVDVEDSFNGTASDYARMLGLLPSLSPPSPSSILVFDRQLESPTVEAWDIPKLEKYFNISFCPQIRCTQDYIIELMFSGFQIEKDTKFREQYGDQIYTSSGDENVILVWISEEVGWGVYALKDFNEGDYILRYGGDLMLEEKIRNKNYNMMVSFEDYTLSAYERRNMGGFINHSPNFNAESQCIFEKGAEQALITATTFIPKGKQILIDYSTSYWGVTEDQEKTETVVPLGLSESFPTFLPPSVVEDALKLKFSPK